MLETVTTYLQQYGYAALFVILFLESTGLPLPGESLVMASGLLAGNGQLDIRAVFVIGWLGATLGDNLGYGIGRRYGRWMLLRHGARVGMTERRFALVEARFRHYGVGIVLVARFIIILRQLNGFIAGTLHMPWWRFLLYNAIGAALWVGAYSFGAYFFGQALEYFFEGIPIWVPLGLVALMAAVGFFGTYRLLLEEEKSDGK